MHSLKKYLSVNPEVKEALINRQPVVALESTIISHGMPYPQNVETALNVEKIIRENGAIPATIAILQGKLTVGCTPAQIEHLGRKGLEVTKASRRDLPVLLSRPDVIPVMASSFLRPGSGKAAEAPGPPPGSPSHGLRLRRPPSPSRAPNTFRRSGP